MDGKRWGDSSINVLVESDTHTLSLDTDTCAWLDTKHMFPSLFSLSYVFKCMNFSSVNMK